MFETIEIPDSSGRYIRGSYTCSEESSIVDIDHLLIIMAHGFPGSKDAHNGLYNDIARRLHKKDYHSLALDFCGCGESDGDPEDFTISTACENFQMALYWAKSKGYKRFIFIGEGLGAAISIMNMRDDLACLVLLWPMLDLPYIAETVFKAGNSENAENPVIVNAAPVNAQFIKELQETDLSSALKKINKPVLVMHGRKDTISPIEQLDLLRSAAIAKRIEITSFQDGEHGLPKANHRKTMYYHLMQFIEKYS